MKRPAKRVPEGGNHYVQVGARIPSALKSQFQDYVDSERRVFSREVAIALKEFLQRHHVQAGARS